MMLKCLCLLLKPCRFTDVTVVISIFWWIKNCLVDKHYLQIDCLCSFLFLVFIRTWSKTARILSIIWQSGVVRIQKLGIIPMNANHVFLVVFTCDIPWNLMISPWFGILGCSNHQILTLTICAMVNCHQYTRRFCQWHGSMAISGT